MAAVTYSDGTEKDVGLTPEAELKIWISPSTMDSGDTVTPPAITGKTIRVLAARDLTTGDSVTTTVSAGVITIDAAGGTTNKVYSLLYTYV